MFLTLLALMACRSEPPAAACTTTPWFADADGDGFGDPTTRTDACDAPLAFVADATDCEDADPAVFPGAPEQCDGVDQDCDAVVDNAPIDAVAVYVDVDGDGYAGAETTLACEGPTEPTDCDDADPEVSPDAVERCDGVDEDCDGAVDEDAIDPSTWYADADADGFGDAGVAVFACQAPAGHVADATDCDDGDTTITPVATEVCDGIDQDCDGVVDDDAADASLWYADTDGDGVGDFAAMIAACEPAGVSFGGDCDDTDPTVSPNATEHCDDRDEDCDGEVDEYAVDPPTWYIDGDADGFGSAPYVACDAASGTVADGGDCDDGDPAISPGATELCSTAADDDCDGAVDDGADVSTWYEDLDEDEWGDAAAPVTACVDTRWLAATPGDCDPSDHAVYPGAIEWCNTVDDDCDGDIDEDSALDAVSWYTDADADAWGDTETLATACTVPTGGVSRGGDCDDTERAISPSADEVCDGEDNNCDGAVDVDAVDATYSYADADGDGWGDDTTEVYACDVPVGSVGEGGDCDDGDVAFHPEQADAWGDGVDADCDGYDDMIAASAADVVLRGEATNDHAGSGLAGADVNGDGYADVIVGAKAAGAGGRAYLYFGPISASGLLSDADVLFEGVGADDATGSFLRAGGDADADGLPDLLVGASNASRAVDDGVIYILTDVATASLASAPTLESVAADDAVGTVADWTGDLDGDGLDDVLVSAYLRDGPLQSGSVYVALAPFVGATSLSTASAELRGEASNDLLGVSVAGVGDITGDGVPDLLVGASGNDTVAASAGAAYLVEGPTSGTMTIDTVATTTFYGATSGDRIGGALAAAGDVNGDGRGDLLLGGDGQAHLFTSAPTGSVSIVTADTIVHGVPDVNEAAEVVGGIGDFDGDGRPDLAFGDSTADDGAADAGAVWVLTGVGTGTYALTDAYVAIAGEDGEQIGDLWGVGDTDGDGFDDLLVGGTYAYGQRTGGAWLILGR